MSNFFQSDMVHSADLDKIPIIDGRIIRTYDKYDEYFDYNGERHKICEIIQVDTYTDLRRIENPIEGKFYYVKEEDVAQMYYFNGSDFIQTSGYAHPIYNIDAGSYRCVTINRMGHVTEANNDILPVSLGGTGVDNIDTLRENMNVPTIEDLNNLNDAVQDNSKSITDINKSIEEINTSIDIKTTELSDSINVLEEAVDIKIDSLNNQVNAITNSYYIRDVESSDWIKDAIDNTYYVMILKSVYGLRESFPITSIYRKTEDGYNMSHGIFDNNDYTITVNDTLDVTVRTTTPFTCKIIINTI